MRVPALWPAEASVTILAFVSAGFYSSRSKIKITVHNFELKRSLINVIQPTRSVAEIQ